MKKKGKSFHFCYVLGLNSYVKPSTLNFRNPGSATDRCMHTDCIQIFDIRTDQRTI